VESEELALFSTKDLIDELLRRNTFLGVVVHSDQEQRTAGWQGDKVFNVRFNANLHQIEAQRLLGVVSEYMQFSDEGA